MSSETGLFTLGQLRVLGAGGLETELGATLGNAD